MAGDQLNGKLMIPIGVVILVIGSVFGFFTWLDNEISAEITDDIEAHNLSIHPETETALSRIAEHLKAIEEILQDTRDKVILLKGQKEGAGGC